MTQLGQPEWANGIKSYNKVNSLKLKIRIEILSTALDLHDALH
jgi:hypothetical protein